MIFDSCFLTLNVLLFYATNNRRVDVHLILSTGYNIHMQLHNNTNTGKSYEVKLFVTKITRNSVNHRVHLNNIYIVLN